LELRTITTLYGEKKEKMRVSDNTAISMPMRNLISILGAVAVGVWAYFGVIERINSIENDNVLIKKDLDQAVEFSIKWPRGELGSLPADSEQFLLIESLLSDVEYIQLEIKESRHNAVNIKRLQQDVDKILAAIEILKDKVRNNGSNSHD
jgi:hypothetical protein